MRHSVRHLATVLLLAAASTAADAAPILDQSFTASASVGTHGFRNQPGSRRDLAQTFTVGLAGVLTGIEIFLDPVQPDGVPVNLEVQTLVSGAPSGVVVATASLPAASITSAGLYLFDVSGAGFGVTPGLQLAAVISAGFDATIGPQNYNAQAAFQPDNTYAGGQFWEQNDGGPWDNTFTVPSDMTFRTYVEAAVAPEPGTIALLLFGGALAVRRRLNR